MTILVTLSTLLIIVSNLKGLYPLYLSTQIICRFPLSPLSSIEQGGGLENWLYFYQISHYVSRLSKRMKTQERERAGNIKK